MVQYLASTENVKTVRYDRRYSTVSCSVNGLRRRTRTWKSEISVLGLFGEKKHLMGQSPQDNIVVVYLEILSVVIILRSLTGPLLLPLSSGEVSKVRYSSGG